MEHGKEEELVRRAARGDSRAFRDLLDLHYGTVYRMAYRLSGHREDAEDITQMACLKIAQNIQGFRTDSKFTTWVYTIVLNTFRDWTDNKANTRKGHIDVDTMTHSLSAASNPETDAHTREQMRKLSALPEDERTAIILVFSEGLSHKEAADVLGCAESTVSWRIHEARKKLTASEGGV